LPGIKMNIAAREIVNKIIDKVFMACRFLMINAVYQAISRNPKPGGLTLWSIDLVV
jgi:hypothetical protein